MTHELLEIENLGKHFGALKALENISLKVPQGSVLGIMGVNGAGKSTLLDCISGIAKPSFGKIRLNGREIHRKTAYEINSSGLGRTFQIPRIFKSITALENLMVVPAANRTAIEMRRHAWSMLENVHLSQVANNYADELSGGQQKLLEFARVLMCQSQIILLDEPFAGMHPDLCRLFIDRVESIVRDGVSLILVTHDPETLYRLSNRIIVLHQGKVIADGTPLQVRENPVVVEAYLGN